MGTAERRIEIMKLLCRERYTTMSVLAEKFNVSIRTIKRDIDELTFIIPLYIKTGRYGGGVYVKEGYSWSRNYMSREDIRLLKHIISVSEKGEILKLDYIDINRLQQMIKTYSVI